MSFVVAKNSFYRQIWQRFSHPILNKIGYYFVIFMFLVAILAPLIANNKPYYLSYQDETYFPILEEVFPFSSFISYPELRNIDFKKLVLNENESIIMPPIPYSPTENNLDIALIAPNSNHLLGTDVNGRDVMSRVIHGSRISLSVGLVAVGLYVTIGIIIGAIAGFFGGFWDMIISRIIEIVMCFPTFFLILTVLAFVGPSLYNIMIVIGLTGWTGIARLVRGEFLRLRQFDYVTSVKAVGASNTRIIFKHILPNALAPVLVSASFGIASSILVESSLSFLGFGVQPPTPSWGEILSQSREFMDIAWWLTIFPGIAIFLTITSFSLVGEGLRDALDPKG
jgi:peptide/nickel transport system permease protein